VIVTLENRQYYSQSELRRMKLSAKQIRELGEPDTTVDNPYGYPGVMKLYAAPRVTTKGKCDDQ
jgi:hypothetical protein